jgi:serine protease Do
VSLYFQNSEQIKRPKFGFKYGLVTNFESQLLNISNGLLISEVALSSSQRGLLKDDVIISINNEKFSNISQVEELLEKYKPGDVLNLEIMRSKKTLNVELTVGELK